MRVFAGHHLQCAPAPEGTVSEASSLKGFWDLEPADRQKISSLFLFAEKSKSAEEPAGVPQQSTAVVPALEAFVMPRPGHNGAAPGKFTGKTLVLTGTFPEAGGGAGLELGKAKVKACVESFGGRVTSGVSRKTDILIVGEYRKLARLKAISS